MANAIQSAISSVRKKANEILSDNEGWFRGGKFTPVQQIKDYRTAAKEANRQLPIRNVGPLVLPNWEDPTGQDIYKSFGKGFVNASTFGLVQPQYTPQTNAGKFASGTGFVAGVINPLNPLNKAMGALNIGGKVVSRVAPSIASKTVRKVVGGIGSELAQTAAYTAAQAGSQALGLKPQEEITPKTFGQNLIFGTVLRGALSPQSTGAISQGIKNMFGGDAYVSDFRKVNEARQFLKLNSGKVKDIELGRLKELEDQAEMYRQAYNLDTSKEWKRLSLEKKYDVISEKLDNLVRTGYQPQMGIVGKASKGIETNLEAPKSTQVLQENLPKQAKTSLDLQQPTIRKAAQVDLQSGTVLRPNKLDSASEQIIQQARGQIGKPTETKRSLGQVFDDLYTNWVDRYHPLVKLTEGIKNIDPTKDPKYIIRRFLGAGSIAEQRFNTEMRPILKQIDDLKIDKGDLDAYLVSKRNVGFGEIGRKVKGSDPVQSQKVVSALEAKYGQDISTLADQLYQFQNKGLDEMVSAGFISPEDASAMRGQNPNYAPFQRVMDELNDYLGLPTKKAMQGTQPIKKLEGSKRQILSPVESIIANIFSQRAAIEKNNVAKSVAGLQELIPGLNFKTVSKSSDSTITVWQNGKKQYIDVGADIARAMKGMNEETTNSFMKILTAPANLLRQGATGRNPEFMLPNIIRDQLDAAVNSKYGYVPFVDYIRGLYHVARKDITGADEVFDSWMNSGGAQSFSSITGRKSISEMFDKTKAKKNLFSWLGSALDVAGKYSETPTRVGLYGRALKKGASQIEAAYESREGTMDFARMGAKMKVANSIIPFLNVQVQGFDKMIRNFKNDPVKTTLKMGIYGVAPAALTTIYNQAFHPEEYAEIPQYVKDDNFVLVDGRNEDGTVKYITIPKGNLIRLMTNPTEHFISYLAGNDKTTFGEMATQLLSSTLPFLGEGSTPGEVAIKTIGQNIPQAIKPITENLLNKSFYKYDTKKEQSKEIVPYYLQNKPAGEQAYKFTPAMYQAIGRVINVSPLKVQNLMEGYLAGYSKIPANIIDDLKNISENKDVDQNKIPVLRRFIQNTYPSSTSAGAKKETTKAPVINQVNAAEGGVLSRLFPTKAAKNEDGKAEELLYTNENGNEAKINLSKYDDISNLPSSNKYETAIKESKQYSAAANILDNSYLSREQQQEALSRLGVDPEKASYYQIANDDTNKKTMFVLDAVNKVKSSGGGLSDIIQLLANQRTQVNNQMIASNAVLDNLVDEGVITKSQASELKKYKMENGALVSLKKTVTAKKAKKISVTLRKVSARTKVSSSKVKKISKPKLTYKKVKPIKLKTPLLAKR